MKVLHIITGLNQGGAESALFRLVSFNKSDAIKNIVVSMISTGVYGSKLEANGIPVYALDMPRGRITLKGVRLLCKILKKTKPDNIQTWMYHADLFGGVIARLNGHKNISWGIVNFNLSPAITGRSTRLTAKLCALVSGIIPKKIISCSERAVTAHQGIGYDKNKFITIPLGYDLNEFKPYPEKNEDIRKLWGVLANEIVIGCVARWDPQKDHRNLFMAMDNLKITYPQVRCVLVGPGMNSQNRELVEIINAVYKGKSQIILAGLSDNIAAVMSSFDIHVLSSLGEAFPNVVAEAMACGTPCIVTDVGDTALIVGSTGWVVPPANADALSLAIGNAVECITDTVSWNKRKEDCRERIFQNFSMQQMINSYEIVWESMIKK